MLTRLFVTRPTLAAVLVALAAIGGAIAAYTMRVQELPNIVPPNADIVIFYSSAAPAEMRDGIVRPIEDQLAGAPHLIDLAATVQQGFAIVHAVFDLKSNSAEDILEVQRRVQAAVAQLPSDLPPPAVENFDPGQADVVDLTVSSKTIGADDLSALITNKVIPAIEQLPGVGYAQARGLLTPSIQVIADPAKLDSQRLTLADLAHVIATGSVRVPGGIVEGKTRETEIDVRSDIGSAATIAHMPIVMAPSTTRIGDVAHVRDAAEPQRIYSYVAANPGFVINVQKVTDASEVDASRAVVEAIPDLERRFPGLT
ncbi:MAG TPA: efflux RND transporter permease subunit, partial [Candidatus Eremiobacteraceae bacterium]|nr:efflux RND transporter permease subunit [Candidatus Eremiobacteraceae bacterium]